MFKYIVFDFDGTIVDSSSVFLHIGNEIAEKHGIKKITAEELKALNTLTVTEKCKKLGIPLYKVPAIAIEMLEHFYHYTDDLILIDGIKDAIIKLKKFGYRLGIISSNATSNIEKFLDSINMNVFDCIYSSPGIFGKHRTIDKFLKRTNTDKEHVLYIGDESRDIIACKKTNIKMVAVTWGYDSMELLKAHKPDFIACHPSDILDYIKSV